MSQYEFYLPARRRGESNQKKQRHMSAENNTEPQREQTSTRPIDDDALILILDKLSRDWKYLREG